uniref:Uncharacterized protein n=1 Tax=Meloidogyne enterolobii TaxID=390850 RepID=A0A6V7U731_MELEN|nr:unnamed protein product [Meloidogyne enterolobii]
MEGILVLDFYMATAADGEFGFLAEIATLPAVPLPRKGVDEVAIRASRILNNDRGAINYKNLGEIGPNVIIEQCAIDRNGYHLYGNISTSTAAVNMDVHNTLLFFFRANSIRYGRGGLFISARSSSSMSRLRAVIKNNAILMNSNSNNLALGHGNPYIERYGFHDGNEPDEFVQRRPKRQVIF